jgi:hypothetical protein
MGFDRELMEYLLHHLLLLLHLFVMRITRKRMIPMTMMRMVDEEIIILHHHLHRLLLMMEYHFVVVPLMIASYHSQLIFVLMMMWLTMELMRLMVELVMMAYLCHANPPLLLFVPLMMLVQEYLMVSMVGNHEYWLMMGLDHLDLLPILLDLLHQSNPMRTMMGLVRME